MPRSSVFEINTDTLANAQNLREGQKSVEKHNANLVRSASSNFFPVSGPINFHHSSP